MRNYRKATVSLGFVAFSISLSAQLIYSPDAKSQDSSSSLTGSNFGSVLPQGKFANPSSPFFAPSPFSDKLGVSPENAYSGSDTQSSILTQSAINAASSASDNTVTNVQRAWYKFLEPSLNLTRALEDAEHKRILSVVPMPLNIRGGDRRTDIRTALLRADSSQDYSCFKTIYGSLFGRSNALVMNVSGNIVRVFNVCGKDKDVLFKLSNGQIIALGPGSEMIITKSMDAQDINVCDGVARRGSTKVMKCADLQMAFSQFSYASICELPEMKFYLTHQDPKTVADLKGVISKLDEMRGSNGFKLALLPGERHQLQAEVKRKETSVPGVKAEIAAEQKAKEEREKAAAKAKDEAVKRDLAKGDEAKQKELAKAKAEEAKQKEIAKAKAEEAKQKELAKAKAEEAKQKEIAKAKAEEAKQKELAKAKAEEAKQKEIAKAKAEEAKQKEIAKAKEKELARLRAAEEEQARAKEEEDKARKIAEAKEAARKAKELAKAKAAEQKEKEIAQAKEEAKKLAASEKQKELAKAKEAAEKEKAKIALAEQTARSKAAETQVRELERAKEAQAAAKLAAEKAEQIAKAKQLAAETKAKDRAKLAEAKRLKEEADVARAKQLEEERKLAEAEKRTKDESAKLARAQQAEAVQQAADLARKDKEERVKLALAKKFEIQQKSEALARKAKEDATKLAQAKEAALKSKDRSDVTSGAGTRASDLELSAASNPGGLRGPINTARSGQDAGNSKRESMRLKLLDKAKLMAINARGKEQTKNIADSLKADEVESGTPPLRPAPAQSNASAAPAAAGANASEMAKAIAEKLKEKQKRIASLGGKVKENIAAKAARVAEATKASAAALTPKPVPTTPVTPVVFDQPARKLLPRRLPGPDTPPAIARLLLDADKEEKSAIALRKKADKCIAYAEGGMMNYDQQKMIMAQAREHLKRASEAEERSQALRRQAELADNGKAPL